MSRYIDADFEIAHYTSMTTNPTPDVTEKDKRNSLIILDALRMAKTIDIPQWIPCSERLPSECGRYLVVYPLLIDEPWVSILWYGKPTFPEKDEPCFYASDDEYGDVEYSDVIAWMPLPKPYGERSEP